MSISKRLAGSTRIYDSIDDEDPDINPYSITGPSANNTAGKPSASITGSNPTTNARGSNSTNTTGSSSFPDRNIATSTTEPPIYATVNKKPQPASNNQPVYATVSKATKRPPNLPTQATASAGGPPVAPPKTQAKPQSKTPPTPSSPKVEQGTLRKHLTNGDRGHIYHMPTDVASNETSSGDTTQRNTVHSDDDVIENPYDDIPGQLSPRVQGEIDERPRFASGGSLDDLEDKKRGPKLPPLRGNEPGCNGHASVLKEISVLYVGSMKMTEEQLKDQQNTEVLRRCIAHFSHPSASPQFTAVQEWSTDLNMHLLVDTDSVRLRHSVSKSILVHDDLTKIKIWGTGKEPESSIFAYITRDDSTKGFVCRVLKCREGTGKQVSKIVWEACQTKAVALGAQQKDASLTRKQSNETNVTMHCRYVGKFCFTENSGKDELKKLVDIKLSSPREAWLKVSVEISTSVITVKDTKDVVQANCVVKDIAGIGTFRDDNKFGCITLHASGTTEFTGHLFYCEPSTDHWLLNIQTVCKSQLHESKSGIMKKMHKYFGGGKKN